MTENVEIKGLAVCTKVIFSKGSFVIASFKPVDDSIDLSSFTMKGNMFVNEGQEYEVVGSLDTKNKYKNSYDAITVSQNIDLTKASDKELISFFSTIISNKQAKELVKTLDDPIKVLEEGNVQELIKVNGIGVSRAERLLELYASQKDYSPAIIAFEKYGITEKAIKKIVNYFNSVEKAINIVNNNPYSVVEVPGFGFKKADVMFLTDEDNDAADIRRVRAYVDYLFLEEFDNGNTWITPREFINKFEAYLPMADVRQGIEYINESDNFEVLNTPEDENAPKKITSKRALEMETLIAKHLRRLMEAPSIMELSNSRDIISRVESAQGWRYTEEQRSAIDIMFSENVHMVQGLAGTGKAQDVDLVIPTPTGNKRFGDLLPGDFVFDKDGNPTKVLSIHPQGMMDNYKVTLTDGRSTYCNDEHLWSTYTSKGNLKVRTLREMIDMGLYHGTGGKRNCKFKIPTNGAVEYSEAELPLDPYLVGVFLGDGCGKQVPLSISSDDESIVKEVAKIIGCKKYKRQHETNYTWIFELEEPRLVLRDGCHSSYQACIVKNYQTADVLKDVPEVIGYAHEKRIPHDYKYGSYDQRLSLVQGMFDTDGCINDDSRFNVRYSTVSLGLANDLREVLQSLGMQSTITVDDRGGDTRICYNINVNIPNSKKPLLFRLPRRKDIAEKAALFTKHRDYSKVGIIDVEKMNNKVEMMCIMVDNEDHLYLTNDFIVTHNTSAVNGFLSVIEQNGYSYCQCALSGKAANNMSHITGKDGSTIHSLLGFDPKKKTGFAHDENDPLPYNVIVLDELSMVNAEIFLSLLKAIKTGSKLIMLGDYGQLDSIGVGVMGGLIRSKVVPMTLLKKIHRQAAKSAIITHSIHFREGIIPEELKLTPNTRKVYGENQDMEYIFVKNDEEENIGTAAMRLFKENIEEYGVDGIQIISQTKTTGTASTYRLNKLAQLIANPKRDDLEPEIQLGYNDNKYFIRAGDKVINLKNNKSTMNPAGVETPIFNGNTGIVLNVNPDDRSLLIDFEGIGEVEVTGEAVDKIDLGYAITVHKSQGSTIPCVIFAMPFHFLLNSRELVYTGDTRAKKRQVFITSPKSLRSALKKTSSKIEKTNLAYLLKKEFGNENIDEVA